MSLFVSLGAGVWWGSLGVVVGVLWVMAESSPEK